MTILSGAVKPSSVEQDEHLTISGVGVKRVLVAGYDGTNIHDLATDTNGVLKIGSGFNIPVYDYVTLTQDTLTDVWTFKVGGISGSTVATITITYATSAKVTISTVART
jgi:hypothetical protein